jgi:aspartate/methionine/tyrosine aminotransferase
MLTRNDLQSIMEALRNSSAVVITDEVYRELYFDERPASIADFYPRTVVISGLSKSHAMTGWRLGWIYGDPEIVRHLIVLHQFVTTCASAVSQHAALAAFTDAGGAALADLRQNLRVRRDFLVELIDTELAEFRLHKITPDGAFYLMLEVATLGNSFEVAERMLRNKAAFGDEAEGYLRLSFATDFDMIREGVRRMRLALTT